MQVFIFVFNPDEPKLSLGFHFLNSYINLRSLLVFIVYTLKALLNISLL